MRPASILSNSQNHFLRSLSSDDADLLQPRLKLVELPSGTVLYKADDTIQGVYFPYAGIVSYIVGLASGEIVEAGVIGRNSVVGAGAPLDGGIAINEAMVQVDMSAGFVEVGLLKKLAADSEHFAPLSLGTKKWCWRRFSRWLLAMRCTPWSKG